MVSNDTVFKLPELDVESDLNSCRIEMLFIFPTFGNDRRKDIRINH